MDTFIILPIAIQGLIMLGVLGALIYVIVRRIEKKKKEKFEDRNY